MQTGDAKWWIRPRWRNVGIGIAVTAITLGATFVWLSGPLLLHKALFDMLHPSFIGMLVFRNEGAEVGAILSGFGLIMSALAAFFGLRERLRWLRATPSQRKRKYWHYNPVQVHRFLVGSMIATAFFLACYCWTLWPRYELSQTTLRIVGKAGSETIDLTRITSISIETRDPPRRDLQSKGIIYELELSSAKETILSREMEPVAIAAIVRAIPDDAPCVVTCPPWVPRS